jgi:hypothetical protein
LQEEAAVVQVMNGKQHLMRGKVLRVCVARGRLRHGQYDLSQHFVRVPQVVQVRSAVTAASSTRTPKQQWRGIKRAALVLNINASRGGGGALQLLPIYRERGGKPLFRQRAAVVGVHEVDAERDCGEAQV